MRISDQPGRVCAVCIVAPMLIHKGIGYNDKPIIWFGVILFLWDLFWLIFADAKKYNTIQDRDKHLEEAS